MELKGTNRYDFLMGPGADSSIYIYVQVVSCGDLRERELTRAQFWLGVHLPGRVRVRLFVNRDVFQADTGESWAHPRVSMGGDAGEEAPGVVPTSIGLEERLCADLKVCAGRCSGGDRGFHLGLG